MAHEPYKRKMSGKYKNTCFSVKGDSSSSCEVGKNDTEFDRSFFFSSISRLFAFQKNAWPDNSSVFIVNLARCTWIKEKVFAANVV